MSIRSVAHQCQSEVWFSSVAQTVDQKCQSEVRIKSVAQKCRSETSIRSVARSEKCHSEVLLRSVDQKTSVAQVSLRRVNQKCESEVLLTQCRSEVLLRSVNSAVLLRSVVQKSMSSVDSVLVRNVAQNCRREVWIRSVAHQC